MLYGPCAPPHTPMCANERRTKAQLAPEAPAGLSQQYTKLCRGTIANQWINIVSKWLKRGSDANTQTATEKKKKNLPPS